MPLSGITVNVGKVAVVSVTTPASGSGTAVATGSGFGEYMQAMQSATGARQGGEKLPEAGTDLPARGQDVSSGAAVEPQQRESDSAADSERLASAGHVGAADDADASVAAEAVGAGVTDEVADAADRTEVADQDVESGLAPIAQLPATERDPGTQQTPDSTGAVAVEVVVGGAESALPAVADSDPAKAGAGSVTPDDRSGAERSGSIPDRAISAEPIPEGTLPAVAGAVGDVPGALGNEAVSAPAARDAAMAVDPRGVAVTAADANPSPPAAEVRNTQAADAGVGGLSRAASVIAGDAPGSAAPQGSANTAAATGRRDETSRPATGTAVTALAPQTGGDMAMDEEWPGGVMSDDRSPAAAVTGVATARANAHRLVSPATTVDGDGGAAKGAQALPMESVKPTLSADNPGNGSGAQGASVQGGAQHLAAGLSAVQDANPGTALSGGSTTAGAGAATTTATPALAAAAPETAGQPPLPESLARRLQNPLWGRAIGQRAVMMAQYGPRSAEIQLDPPELGALQIRVHLGAQDQVSVSFTSPHAHVREALEQQLPRLREMFSEQGLSLGQSSVSDQPGQQSGERAYGASTQGGGNGEYGQGAAEDATLAGTAATVAVGLVDYYA